MKKSIIAGAGVAALGFAAMPILGVFAETSGTFTDTVEVTVSRSCTFEMNDGATPTPNPINTADRAFSRSTTAGSLVKMGGTGTDTGASSTANVSIVCNTDGTSGSTETWSVTAVGAQAAGSENKMIASGTGTAIETGTTTTGATSYWMFRVAAPATGVVGSYNSWSAIPATAQAIVSGNVSTAAVTFTPEYQVYVGTAQEADTYTGKVKYTISSTL